MVFLNRLLKPDIKILDVITNQIVLRFNFIKFVHWLVIQNKFFVFTVLQKVYFLGSLL